MNQSGHMLGRGASEGADRPCEMTGASRGVLLAGLVVLICLCIGSAMRNVYHVREDQRRVLRTDINDFDRWMRCMPALLHDHIDLPDERSINTIPDLLILSPLAHFSRAGGQVAWAMCKVPIVIAIVFFALGLIGGCGVRVGPLALGLLLASWLWPVIGDIQEGQTNLLMLLPLVAGLWIAQRSRGPADWLAGLLIALAVAIKVTPLIFLPYALWRRCWRLAMAMVAGLVLWFYLVPGLVFGWSQNLNWECQWINIMIVPFVQGDVRVTMGESLASFLTKVLRHVPAFVSDKSGVRVAHYMNVADLSAPVVGWVIRLLLVGLAAAGAWWMRRPLASFRSRRFLLEIGCLGTFMLWASHWTLVAHYVALLLPLCAVAMIQSDAETSAGVRRSATAALIAAAVLMLLTSDLAKVFWGPDGREYMLMINVCLWASVGLVAAIVRSSLEQSASRFLRSEPNAESLSSSGATGRWPRRAGQERWREVWGRGLRRGPWGRDK